MSVARSALAGFATGGRTFTGVTALAIATPPDATTQPDVTLAKQQVKALLALLAVGELVGDKLPQTPSRLGAAGLPGRIAFGAACGAIIARRRSTEPEVPGEASEGAALAPGRVGTPPAQVAVCAAVGAAAAVAGSFAGERFRGWAASKIDHDWVGALLEDAAVAGLSYAAVKAPV